MPGFYVTQSCVDLIQLPWVHEHDSYTMSGSQNFIGLLPILQLLHSFCLLFAMFHEPWWCVTNTAVCILGEHFWIIKATSREAGEIKNSVSIGYWRKIEMAFTIISRMMHMYPALWKEMGLKTEEFIGSLYRNKENYRQPFTGTDLDV